MQVQRLERLQQAVAQLPGQPQRFEQYAALLRQWFDVLAFRLKGDGTPHRVAVLFSDSAARWQAAQQQRVAAVLEGQAEERRRTAESLHNGLCQLLYAAKLQLDRLPQQPPTATHKEASSLLSEAIRQARTISHELTPALLADFGLQVALENIYYQLSNGLRWQCHIKLRERPPLPLALQQAVYRLAQEPAYNVAKHAQAREATLEVGALPGWVVLRVEDDGCSFSPASVAGGLSLKTLRSPVGRHCHDRFSAGARHPDFGAPAPGRRTLGQPGPPAPPRAAQRTE